MTLACDNLKELDNPSLTADERALLRCAVAADLVQRGQYESAREALGDFWRGIGVRPDVQTLDKDVSAEVLLQVGNLSGWLGASKQARGAQASAKDLISESAALFERSGDAAKAAYARSDLALCYWREGAYDEARILLTQAFGELADAPPERRAVILLRRVTVECAAGRLHSALSILKESDQMLNESDNHTLRGSFHNLHAGDAAAARRHRQERILLRPRHHGVHRGRLPLRARAARALRRGHREQPRGAALQARQVTPTRTEHLDRAGITLSRLGDAGLLAQIDRTRAQVLIAEKQYRDAARIIAGAVERWSRAARTRCSPTR
jgi:tetratricopeptide (TPR) repeat protein